MRIFCVGPAYPYRGGIANFNMALSMALKKRGHQIEVISFRYLYPSILFPGKTQYDEEGTTPDLKISRLISSINPFSWFKSARYVIKNSPDLIIAHHWMPFISFSLAFLIRRITRSAPCRVIAIVHNAIPHEKHPGWKSLTRYFMRSCDGFIGMSRSVLIDIARFTDSSFKSFIPHPVYDIFGSKSTREDAARILGIPANRKFLLFFGIIRKYKGLHILLDAMPAIVNEIRDIQLIIAGEFYTSRDEYDVKINNSGLQKYIHLFGQFIPAEEVKYYFSLADLVVQPYISATQSGITQIAYHFEVPMLVTNVGGLAEMVPDGKVGYVVEPEAKAVSDAVIDFFRNDRAETFQHNIMIEKQRFTWDNMADGIIELAGQIKAFLAH